MSYCGGVDDDFGAGLGIDFVGLANETDVIIKKFRSLGGVFSELESIFDKLSSEVMATTDDIEDLGDVAESGKKPAPRPGAFRDDASAADAELEAAQTEQSQNLRASSEELDKFSATSQRLAGAFNQAAFGAVALTVAYGTLIESSEDLTEEQKRVAQAGVNAAAAQIAVAAQVASFGFEEIV